MAQRTLVVAFVVALLALSRSVHSQPTEVTSADEMDDGVIVAPAVDSALANVGPTRNGRVGLWTFGDSYESDALFFDEEDKRFAAWYIEHQKEQQRKKIEEKKQSAKRSGKRDQRKSGGDPSKNQKQPAGAEDDAITTKAAVTLRSSTRRKVLDSSSNPLHTKLKTLHVDVKGAYRRFQKAIGVVNHTLTDDEAEYQSLVEGVFLRSARNTTIDDFPSLTNAAILNDAKSTMKKTNLTTANTTNTSTSLVTGALAALTTKVFSGLSRVYLAPSLPLPLLLDDEMVKLLELEADLLRADAMNLDSNLHRAESGLHESERRLRETRLKKASAEDESEKQRLPASGSNDQAAEIRRRQEERMSKYTEMRTLLNDDLLQKIDMMKAVLKTHRTHQFQLVRAALPLATTQIASERERLASLQSAMTKNDESTVQLRQQMKSMNKEMKLIQSNIQELEALEKAGGALTRRRSVSVPLSTVVSALKWNARLRQAVELPDAESALPAQPWLVATFGLTKQELQDLLVIPLLISTLACWVLQFLLRMASKAVVFISRKVSVREAKRKAIIAPKSNDEVARFDFRLFAYQCFGFVMRVALLVNSFVSLILPIIAPLASIVLVEGYLVAKDVRSPDDALPLSLLYRVNVLLSPSQRIITLACVAATVIANILLTEPKQASKVGPIGGRKLGRR